MRVVGDDGSGKWTLANRLVHEAQVVAAFPDGVIRIDEGSNGYPTGALDAYARAVGVDDLVDPSSQVLHADRFRKIFAARRVLFVIEQRTASDVAPTLFSRCGPRCTLLHLTNHEREDAARVVRLSPFEAGDMARLVMRDNPLRAPLQPRWWAMLVATRCSSNLRPAARASAPCCRIGRKKPDGV